MGSFQSPHANRQKRRRLSFVMRLCLVYAAGVLDCSFFFPSMNCQVNMQVESHHSSSPVQTEQRIEGEKERHTTRPSAADSNKQHPQPAEVSFEAQPSPAQSQPNICCSLLSLTHHQQSQDPASAGADWATVLHGHFRLEIAESHCHSLPHSRRWVSWARFQIHVPSCHGTGWLRDIAQLVSDSVAVDWPPGQHHM